MTTDRDFDGIAKAWLAEGPAELSDRVLVAVVDEIHQTRQRHSLRVPWRFPTMSISARTSALLLIGALAAAAGLAIIGGIGGTAPTPTPTSFTLQPAVLPIGSPIAGPAATPAASAAASGAAETFTSPRYGYSIRYPSGWIANPATKPWLAGADTLYGDPALDTIGTSDARLAVASQPLAGTTYVDRKQREGQTPSDWLLANCGSKGLTAAACGPRILIGGQPGWLHEDGAPASGGTVATGGVIFDAAIVFGDRGYEFTLDGKVDRALFDTLLASVTFDADSAIDLPPLTKTFTSPTYGYTIGIGEGFITTPATSTWIPGENTGDAPQDVIGTAAKYDWFLSIASTAIPAGTTFDEWLAAEFPGKAADSDAGTCKLDDPATWPLIQVGNEVGRLDRHCHGMDALVGVGGRAYIFSWQYQVTDTNHTFADWKEMLKSVTFDPSSASASISDGARS
jgi:hypothetical protein